MQEEILRWLQNREQGLVTALRVTLGIIFFWFGALKIAGYNPVYELVYHSMAPILADGVGLYALGGFESLIGVLLLSGRARFFTHLALFLHLAGTFSTFIFGWGVIFTPFFPVLSLPGEFVVKNMTLALAGLVALSYESRRRRAAVSGRGLS